jgi:2-dehydropantoate 2-reductase
MLKTKFIIAGICGVGDYFGGLLANHFYENDLIEIDFLARGSHLKEIQEKGLKVIQGEREFIAKPALATDNATDIGKADFIIIATKSYDLEKIVE